MWWFHQNANTEEDKRGTLHYKYHRRSDHHTMDCYALSNIFHERVAKGDLVIKNGKRANARMNRPKGDYDLDL